MRFLRVHVLSLLVLVLAPGLSERAYAQTGSSPSLTLSDYYLPASSADGSIQVSLRGTLNDYYIIATGPSQSLFTQVDGKAALASGAQVLRAGRIDRSEGITVSFQPPESGARTYFQAMVSKKTDGSGASYSEIRSVVAVSTLLQAEQFQGPAGPQGPVGPMGPPAPVNGPDFWSGLSQARDLFRPHANNCDPSSETFVPVGGTSQGFCIERDERGAATWEDARETCSSEEKRMVEPSEFKFTCARAEALGLNSMTDNKEWLGNQLVGYFNAGMDHGVLAHIQWPGGCYAQGLWPVALTSSSAEVALPFRCVR